MGTVQSPSCHNLNPISGEAAFADAGSVTVELPWVPLSSREDSFLTQTVLRDRAPAVRCAIDLYMLCRAQPHFDIPLRRRLTVHLWHVLGAAHPCHACQWWEWESAYQQFSQLARDFLKRSPLERERTPQDSG